MSASLPLYPTPISQLQYFSTPRLTQALYRLAVCMQNFEPFRASFNDGVAEGGRFLALLTEIGPVHEARCSEFATPDELQPIFDYMVQRSARYAYPYVEGFLSRAIKPKEFDADIIWLWGIDNFIEMQSQCAPTCNFGDELQLVQFGYVSGDGDAWCLDLKNQEIICISPCLLYTSPSPRD